MKTKLPWSVYAKKLRSQFSTRIVEIVDADGKTVLPWGGFDGTGMDHAGQKRLAAFIVEAVNAQYRPIPKPSGGAK